jgi:hypothetical protein
LFEGLENNKSIRHGGLVFWPVLGVAQKFYIDNMLPLARLEELPKSGASLVFLFVSANLSIKRSIMENTSKIGLPFSFQL